MWNNMLIAIMAFCVFGTLSWMVYLDHKETMERIKRGLPEPEPESED